MLVLAGLTMAVASALAQVPASDLANRPPRRAHFVIQSTGGKHGDSWTWVAPDGARMGRESMNLRGQVFELDSTARAGADGLPSSVGDSRRDAAGRCGRDLQRRQRDGELEEPRRRGKAAYSAPAFYVSQGGPIAGTAWFLESLLASPDKSLDLLPGGRARAARLIDLEVGTGAGPPDDHAVVGDRHRHLAAACLGGREQQVLRAHLRDRVAAGGVYRRADED